MNDIFYEENFIFESSMSIIENRMISDIIYYEEQYSKNHYFTENEKRSLIFKTRQLISRLINTINTFMKNIKVKIDNFIRANKIDIELMNRKRYYEKMKKKGMTTVITIDSDEYRNTYLKGINELWRYVDKIKKMKYTSANQIKDDIDKFKNIMEKYDKELDKIYDNKIEISIDKAIEILDKEIHGKSDVFQTIRDCEIKLEEMNIYIQHIENNIDSGGDSIIPKKIGFLEKMITKISTFIKKGVSRFIAVTVFLFAI